MKAINYERVVETAVSNATVLDHTISPCEESFIPNVTVRLRLSSIEYIYVYFFYLNCRWFLNNNFIEFKGETFVVYMKMEHARDTVTWLQIAKVIIYMHNIIQEPRTNPCSILLQKLMVFSFLKQNKCFKIWDLDARGSHKGLWRFYLKNNSIVVVGVPFSPYS